MDLNHEFEVPVTVDEAWKILTDVERIAPCLPGAELQEIEGDTYRGVVKVKVGPIQAQFKGQASFVERDDTAHKAVLRGEGRDTGGKGNASALITAQLTGITSGSTKVEVTTDLSITGKIAQFGRGAMADISDKILGQFVENLNTLIASQPAAPAAEAPAAAQPAAADAGPRKIDGPEAKPIDLLDAAGAPILKRALPVVVVVAAVIVWLVVK
ncbi:MAG: SRPBCC family protein [Actinomycetes bacterium]|jgi:carbon monoxide dehydrogenase subunit G